MNTHLLQIGVDTLAEKGGWITATVLVFGYVITLLKNRNDNSTKIKLSELESLKGSLEDRNKQIIDLSGKLDDLNKKSDEMKHQLDIFMKAFSIIAPILRSYKSENQEVKDMIASALKILEDK